VIIVVEIATIKELEKKYNDEWVLIEVLEEDSFGNPTKGCLIAHSKRRDDVYDALKNTKNIDACIFFAGDIPKKGHAFGF
jgi:hypothetical protein